MLLSKVYLQLIEMSSNVVICNMFEEMSRTFVVVGVFGIIAATSVCKKMKVSTTVTAMLSLLSDFSGRNTEEIPATVTSNIGTIRL